MRSTIRPLRPQPTSAGTESSHQVRVADVRCSPRISRPAAVRNSSRRPGWPDTGSVRLAGGGAGTASQVSQPGTACTRARPASAAVIASAGTETLDGITPALPPPWMVGQKALGPATVTLDRDAGSSGRAPASLRSSTNEAAVARRSRSGLIMTAPFTSPAPASAGGPGGPARLFEMNSGSRAPSRRASRSSRRTLSSTTCSLTVPSSTALTSASAHGPAGPGMDRSSPPSAVAAVLRAACQSETTTPSKPHSSLSTSRSSAGFSVMLAPLTRL